MEAIASSAGVHCLYVAYSSGKVVTAGRVAFTKVF